MKEFGLQNDFSYFKDYKKPFTLSQKGKQLTVSIDWFNSRVGSFHQSTNNEKKRNHHENTRECLKKQDRNKKLNLRTYHKVFNGHLQLRARRWIQRNPIRADLSFILSKSRLLWGFYWPRERQVLSWISQVSFVELSIDKFCWRC